MMYPRTIAASSTTAPATAFTIVQRVSLLFPPRPIVLVRTTYYLVGLFLTLPWMIQTLRTTPLPQRHICLLDSYSKVRGPFMTALVDQLAERATGHGVSDMLSIVLCHDSTNIDTSSEFNSLQDDLPHSRIYQLDLSDYNPLSLDVQMDQWRPNILWVTGGTTTTTNAFSLRYKLRTSGLDRWIERNCCGVSASTCVYIGEDSGAICAGASLQVARSILQQDPKAAPEPQFFGMGLLGPEKTIAFTTMEMKDQRQVRSSHADLDEGKLTLLQPEQVYVWSQSSDGHETSVSSFIYLPNQRGMMEQMISPEPLPPIMDDDEANKGGVPCFGEPAVDPSRQMQSSTIGDSEWIDG